MSDSLSSEQDHLRDALRRDIEEAIRQIANGEYYEFDDSSLDEFFGELKAKAAS